MQPPGQVMTSMKCRSSRPARISLSSRLTLPTPLTTATPSWMPWMFRCASLCPAKPRTASTLRLASSSPVSRIVGGADGRFHHAAGGAEDLAGGRPFAERRVRLFRRHVPQVDAAHADQAGQFPRGEHGVDVGNSVPRHFRPGRLELLGRAGHDAHAEDAGRVDARRARRRSS